MDKKKKNVQVTKLAQTRCQNVSMSKIDRLKFGWPYFFILKIERL
jgi:hypothetical protein